LTGNWQNEITTQAHLRAIHHLRYANSVPLIKLIPKKCKIMIMMIQQLKEQEIRMQGSQKIIGD